MTFTVITASRLLFGTKNKQAYGDFLDKKVWIQCLNLPDLDITQKI
jgi:hypothetical protein